MKSKLSEISSNLIKLHRDLIFYQASLVEKEDQRQYSPYELLPLVIHDPRFEWLRRFSELITQIDMITDDKENKPFDLQAIIDEINKIIDADSAKASPNYKLALLGSTETIGKYFEVKKSLTSLEAMQPSFHEAHTDNEKKKHQH
ncbi:MAG: hypothetical protein WA160_10655 [Pseudobdellovibrio sp.]